MPPTVAEHSAASPSPAAAPPAGRGAARLGERVRAFDRWKGEVAQAILDYRRWLQEHRLDQAELDRRLEELLGALHGDRLTLAFVAEFSRGKTELINAVFFADYGRRLLPSEAGRTTMCPTEIYYDREADEAYIRLLPVETRAEDATLAELKACPERWHHLPLEVNDPARVAEALREVTRTKEVPLEEARRLGLVPEEPGTEAPPERVTIPAWRHALISFPHPLLQQGLCILDTPGLNALGAEPELTLTMLPGAQAVLFILAADTGVTRSDLELWRHHIRASRGPERAGARGLVAALNKIDTLWDEMKSPEEVEEDIRRQVEESARHLGVEPERVFPVSAQKALVAKTRGDAELLARSRLPALEAFLAGEVLPARELIVHDTVAAKAAELLEETRGQLLARLEATRRQLEELRSLAGRNSEVVAALMRKTRERQAAYNRNMESLQAARRILAQHAKAILDQLSLEAVDALVERTRREMQGSWTTMGLKRGMKTLFDGIRDTMQQVGVQAERAQKAVQTIYRKFQEEHGLPPTEVPPLSLQEHRMHLERLYEEAEAFRNSPLTTMTEQHFVIKKFFISLVAHAREVFRRAHGEADEWLRRIGAPLVQQVAENKRLLDQHLETLCRINESRDQLEEKLRELERRLRVLEREEATLAAIRDRLLAPPPSGAS
ncbi:MAG: hypothetical protein D6809_05965 [Gammaproteobacteria bacterium]|nr:MAG: hypothetical protein D6809_05965 [Gammaproteobacteria bacterium]